MAAVWTEQRERSNLVSLRIFVWLALRLGRRAARVLLVPVCIYFMLFAPRARRASRSYLARVLGRRATIADGYRHVHCFASTILDRVFFLNGRDDLFDLRIHGESLMRDALVAGNGAFLIGSHLGSFEVVRAVGHSVPGLRATLVMYEEAARKLNTVLTAINPGLMQNIIPLGRIDSMLRLKRCLDRGDFVGMLCDRTLGDEPMRRVEMLGGAVDLPIGPFKLAAMLQRPVILMVGLYRGRNRYDVHFERLADFSGAGAAAKSGLKSDVGSTARLDSAANPDMNQGVKTATSSAERSTATSSAERPLATATAIGAAIDRYAERLEYFSRSAPYNWFNFYDLWEVGGANGPATPPRDRAT